MYARQGREAGTRANRNGRKAKPRQKANLTRKKKKAGYGGAQSRRAMRKGKRRPTKKRGGTKVAMPGAKVPLAASASRTEQGNDPRAPSSSMVSRMPLPSTATSPPPKSISTLQNSLYRPGAFFRKVILETTTPDKDAVEMDHSKRGESMSKSHANSVKLLRRTGRKRLSRKARKTRKKVGAKKEHKRNVAPGRPSRKYTTARAGQRAALSKLVKKRTAFGGTRRNAKKKISAQIKNEKKRKIGKRKKIDSVKHHSRDDLFGSVTEYTGLDMIDDESIQSDRSDTALDMLSEAGNDSMAMFSEFQRPKYNHMEASVASSDLSPRKLELSSKVDSCLTPIRNVPSDIISAVSPIADNLETLGKLRIPQSLLAKRMSSNVSQGDDSIAKLNEHLGEALTLREENFGSHDGNSEAFPATQVPKDANAPPTPASVFQGENLQSNSTIISRIKFVADRRSRAKQRGPYS